MQFNLPDVNKALFKTFEQHVGCTIEVEADFVREPPDDTDYLTVMCRTCGRPLMSVRRDGQEDS